jgi:hypothetical protein
MEVKVRFELEGPDWFETEHPFPPLRVRLCRGVVEKWWPGLGVGGGTLCAQTGPPFADGRWVSFQLEPDTSEGHYGYLEGRRVELFRVTYQRIRGVFGTEVFWVTLEPTKEPSDGA